MPETEPTPALSRISTEWDLLFQAHRGRGDEVPEAQQLLLRRYSGAVYRYLFRAVRDPDTAAELSQEFALRFLRGGFRRASPERGRFRDYVRTVLQNLVMDYHRRRQTQPGPLPDDSALHRASASAIDRDEQEFLAAWRKELLDRTWEALAAVETQTGTLFHTVLLWRAEHPDTPAVEGAGQLTARLGRPFTEGGIRQTLHRARGKFAELLVAEVARSLEGPTPEELEQELCDLGLLEYCRPR